jgi:SNF2 family DNA or RNA helicase
MEDYQQLIKRLHRRGVKGQVRVHRIIATDTMDEVVVKRLESKATNQTALLDTIKAYMASKTGLVMGFDTIPVGTVLPVLSGPRGRYWR